MFDGLQDRLQGVFRDLKGEGRVSPEALDSALRQIRMALLEADVHFRVVKLNAAELLDLSFLERLAQERKAKGG